MDLCSLRWFAVTQGDSWGGLEEAWLGWVCRVHGAPHSADAHQDHGASSILPNSIIFILYFCISQKKFFAVAGRFGARFRSGDSRFLSMSLYICWLANGTHWKETKILWKMLEKNFTSCWTCWSMGSGMGSGEGFYLYRIKFVPGQWDGLYGRPSLWIWGRKVNFKVESLSKYVKTCQFHHFQVGYCH